jgi:anaerobic selenocysteine-containing dehydrogenase
MTLDENNRVIAIRGDKDNPRTKGFACAKGLNQAAHLDSPHRLTMPLKRIGNRLVEVSWDEALDGVAGGLRRIRDTYGARSLALALGGSAHPTIQVMLAFALMRSLGSRNLYSPVGLELTSKYLANQKLFGCSQMDGHPDFEHAQFIILVGTNPLISSPIHGSSLRNASKDPARTLVVVDPRLTETARLADIYTPIRPSTDIYFFLSLLHVLTSEGLYRPDIVQKHSRGLEEVKRSVARFTPEAVERVTGIDRDLIYRIARGFGTARSGVIFYDMGAIANRHSTLVSWASQVLMFITGRLGNQGGSLLNPTLLNHNSLEKRAFGGDTYVSRIRGYPEICGFMPVTVLQDEILTAGPGQIRGLIATGCNPLRAYANSAKMERAFRQLELLVSIDLFLTEVGRIAHYVLPVCSFYEQDNISFGFHGMYPTRFVQLTRKVREPLGNSRPEWMIYRDIARRAGAYWLDNEFLHYGFEAAERILRIATGSGELDRQELMFRLLARVGGTSLSELRSRPHGFTLARGKPFDVFEEIRTPDKKARLAVPEFLAAVDRLVLEPAPKNRAYPLLLSTTCRTWANVNTLYRNEAWISSHMPENALVMHPRDARAMKIAAGEQVWMATRTGKARVRVSLSKDVSPGTVYLSHGWGLSSRDPKKGPRPLRGTPAALFVADDEGDEFTGMPFFSGIPCKVGKVRSTPAAGAKKALR